MSASDRSADGLRRNRTVRVPPCDVERRRHFMRLAAGIGIVALGEGSGLGSLLGAMQEGDDSDGCVTTETYSSSTSSSTSFPSHASDSWSFTSPDDFCTGTRTTSNSVSGPRTYSFSGHFGGVHEGSSTFGGGYTQSSAHPGSTTYSEKCANGTLSFTYSSCSHSSYTSSYSQTESGSRTVPCPPKAFIPPAERPADRPPELPATLEDGRSVVHFSARVRQECERRLRMLGSLREA